MSVASTHNKVSKLATKAIVNAVIQTFALTMPPKFGKLNCARKESKSVGTGILTRCSEVIPYAVFCVKVKYKIPTNTATRGP